MTSISLLLNCESQEEYHAICDQLASLIKSDNPIAVNTNHWHCQVYEMDKPRGVSWLKSKLIKPRESEAESVGDKICIFLESYKEKFTPHAGLIGSLLTRWAKHPSIVERIIKITTDNIDEREKKSELYTPKLKLIECWLYKIMKKKKFALLRKKKHMRKRIKN